MRTFGKKQVEEETEIDITPMLDVVFIMLIFFIVTASFVKEAGVNVLKPEAKTATPKRKANILVAIDAKNAVWIAGEKVDLTEIAVSVKKLRAENPKGTVVIQADKESNHDSLMEVMKAINSAGITDLAISTDS